ncbi:MAG: hypothetical protein Q8M53_05260 [Burkholderiales bacterium]|nr:hypothetical protein [Burkholderiales bacterium]MDP3715857.1 hypothetical protein [Burkholderiales bacterium]
MTTEKKIKIAVTLVFLYGIHAGNVRGFHIIYVTLLLVCMWYGFDEVDRFLSRRKPPPEEPPKPRAPPPPEISPEEKTYEFEFMGMKVQPVAINGQRLWKTKEGSIYSIDGTAIHRHDSGHPPPKLDGE